MYCLQSTPPLLQVPLSNSQHDSVHIPNTISRMKVPTLAMSMNAPKQSLSPKTKSGSIHFQPRLSPSTIKKASPTVCLTNASAVRTSTTSLQHSPAGFPEHQTSQSFIPFPTSAPIDCPPPRTSSDEVDPGTEVACSGSQVCARLDVQTQSNPANLPAGIPEPRKRRVRSFLNSSSSPTSLHKVPSKRPKVPKPLKGRKTRRQIADFQFTALMHRSIAWHIRASCLDNMEVDSGASHPLQLALEQDALLVERLWKNLVDQGFKPVISQGITSTNDVRPDSDSPISPVVVSSPANFKQPANNRSSECISRVEGSQSSPHLMSNIQSPIEKDRRLTRLSIPSGQALTAKNSGTNSIPPPDSTLSMTTSPSLSTANRDLHNHAYPTRVPVSPTTPSPTSSLIPGGKGSEVVPMSRLVASLILRMNDRRASRPRSSSTVLSEQRQHELDLHQTRDGSSSTRSPSSSTVPRPKPRRCSPLHDTFTASSTELSC